MPVTHSLRAIVKTLSVLLLGWGGLALGADLKGGTLEYTIRLSSPARGENTIIYLEGVKGQFPVSAGSVEIDQRNKVFLPHLLALQKGQTVKFLNGDSFSHNIHVYWGRRSLFNLVQGIRGNHDWKPPRKGEFLILCDIHRNMSAFAFVFDHPFFRSVVHKGKARIAKGSLEQVPGGEYTVVAVRDVHGRLKKLRQTVTVQPGERERVSFRF